MISTSTDEPGPSTPPRPAKGRLGRRRLERRAEDEVRIRALIRGLAGERILAPGEADRTRRACANALRLMRAAKAENVPFTYRDAIGLALWHTVVAVIGYGSHDTHAYLAARIQALMMFVLAAPRPLRRAGFLDPAPSTQTQQVSPPAGHAAAESLARREATYLSVDLLNADRRWCRWGRDVTRPLSEGVDHVGGVLRLCLEWGLHADLERTARALRAQVRRIAEITEARGRYCEAADVLPALRVAVADEASTEMLTRFCPDGALRLNERSVRDRIQESLARVEAEGEVDPTRQPGEEPLWRLVGAREMLERAERAQAAREVRDLLETIQRERAGMRIRSDARAVRAVRANLVALLLEEKSQAEVAAEAGCAVSRVSEALDAERTAVLRDPRWEAFAA